jgi:hypothetical protein
MTFDKLTEREIDIYWSGREEEKDDVVRKLIHEKSTPEAYLFTGRDPSKPMSKKNIHKKTNIVVNKTT